jgi:hypothetical protein
MSLVNGPRVPYRLIETMNTVSVIRSFPLTHVRVHQTYFDSAFEILSESLPISAPPRRLVAMFYLTPLLPNA